MKKGDTGGTTTGIGLKGRGQNGTTTGFVIGVETIIPSGLTHDRFGKKLKLPRYGIGLTFTSVTGKNPLNVGNDTVEDEVNEADSIWLLCTVTSDDDDGAVEDESILLLLRLGDPDSSSIDPHVIIISSRVRFCFCVSKNNNIQTKHKRRGHSGKTYDF